MLSGVLERSTPTPPKAAEPDPELDDVEAPADDAGDASESGPQPKARGRGGSSKARADARVKAANKVKGRTLYLPDALFERIIVQAHRRNMNYSDYVTWVLDKNVPDHLARGRAEGDGAAA